MNDEPSAKKLKSGIDFDSIAHQVFVDKSRVPYSSLKSSRQYALKKEMASSIELLFRKYKVDESEDGIDCLRYVEKMLYQSCPNEIVSHDSVIAEQMKTLTLPKRKELVRHLTHDGERLNEEVLALFPSLRTQSEHLLGANSRKERADKIDLSFISDFMHNYCRVNTFGSKVKVGEDRYHAVHEYTDTLKNIYMDDFRNSIEFQNFAQRTGRSSVSYGLFLKGALSCKCIKAPVMRVCVDEVETAFNEMVKSVNNVRKANRAQRKPPCPCMFCINLAAEEERHEAGEFIHPLSSGVMLLKHLLCERMLFPSKERPGVERPKIFRKNCCYHNCDNCKTFQDSAACILQCPALFDETVTYKWRNYAEIVLDNGKSITELKEYYGTVAEFRATFYAQIRKYKLHYFKYKWLNLCRHEDISRLGPNSLLIQTDYSAQPVLDSQDKLNSVGHGVCVLSCWIVLHSPRLETYTTETGEVVSYTFLDCDHIRVVTPSTGKQKDQDWFLHCKIFEQLLGLYKVKIPGLDRVTVWTDGAPNQYKNRYNFYWLAMAYERFGVRICHRFGATAQFKGVHDKIGQVAKWTVKVREKLGTVRVSTAYQFFKALIDHLEFVPPRHLEKRAKPTFEATGHQLYYYAAGEADEAGKTLVSVTLDRTEMWDCNKVKGSSSAYEFVGLRKCGEDNMMMKRSLPCPCDACFALQFGACSHPDIVGDFEFHEMKYKTYESPDILEVPLEQYVVAVLKAFIKNRTGNNAKQTTKPALIRHIVENYSDYIDFNP